MNKSWLDDYVILQAIAARRVLKPGALACVDAVMHCDLMRPVVMQSDATCCDAI
jgi:hypothetical protein